MKIKHGEWTDPYGKRWVFRIHHCEYCDCAGYDKTDWFASDTAKAQFKFSNIGDLVSLKFKTTARGHRYNPMCIPCIDAAMFPDPVKELGVKQNDY